MLKNLISYCLFLFSMLCISQNIIIEGVVKDYDNIPIPFSNVTLYDAENDSFLKGTTTDELGFFKLENLETGSYILRISYLGFDEFEATYTIIKNLNIGIIVLEDKVFLNNKKLICNLIFY